VIPGVTPEDRVPYSATPISVCGSLLAWDYGEGTVTRISLEGRLSTPFALTALVV